MNDCPCCSGRLLRHIRHSGLYWFCPHCHEEMPNLSSMIGVRYFKVLASVRLSQAYPFFGMEVA